MQILSLEVENLTSTNTEKETNIMTNTFALEALTTLAEAEGVTLEEAYEDLEGDYQLSLEGYLNAPAGMFYSNSSPEQKEIWEACREYINEVHPADYGSEETTNALADEVDFGGLVHHTECMEAGLDLIEELDEHLEDIEAFKAIKTLWKTLP